MLITAKIDVKKIIKSFLYEGKVGTYLDLVIWIDEDKPDKYGNTVSIQQKTGKDDPKIYLGNGKVYKKPISEPPQASGEWKGKQPIKSMSDINELSQGKEKDPLPF